jgi:hypothetical protein
MQLELHDPRPEDPAELARMVAVELRKRGIFAKDREDGISIPSGCHWLYNLRAIVFADLGAIAIADEIQRQEALRAQEWAGNE